jgi:hypothetical protein
MRKYQQQLYYWHNFLNDRLFTTGIEILSPIADSTVFDFNDDRIIRLIAFPCGCFGVLIMPFYCCTIAIDNRAVNGNPNIAIQSCKLSNFLPNFSANV